jgi:serine/threonine-protein kinase RsbW
MFPSNARVLGDIRTFVAEACDRIAVSRTDQEDVALAVTEASTNSMTHARSVNVNVEMRIHRDRIDVEVSDDGVFDAVRPRTDRNGGGLGLAVIEALMDDVTLEQGTTERPVTVVRMSKRVRTTDG